ncbi:MAG: hypothetical protein M1458_02330 [Deltaproteobacteria bacterium]|nr:hypothetical protein [Deltaproteobacteria bacterium]
MFEAASFLIFTYLLNLLLFKPMRVILKKREEVIGLNEDKRKDLEKLAGELSEKAGNERENLRFEINEIKERFHKEAQAEADNILSDAKIKAVDNFNKVMEEFNGVKISAAGSLKETAQYLSVLISKKIME